MKSKTILSVIFILALLAGCSKNEEPNMGKVNITFVNKPENLVVRIYALENTSTPIYTKIMTGINSVSVPLSFGNYVVRPIANNTSISAIGFQLNASKKTVDIVYKEDNYMRF